MPPLMLHGSAFVYQGAGCLLIGDSGTGKSRLLADALAQGATLIADDQVELTRVGEVLTAQAPARLSGILELRGLGLVRLPEVASNAPLHLVVVLDAPTLTRLPEAETHIFLELSLPCLRLPPRPDISVAQLLLYLKAVQENRLLPTDWCPTGKKTQ